MKRYRQFQGKLREHPVHESDQMVRAYLDGRKWQTRRPVKQSNSSCAALWDWLEWGDVPEGAMPLLADDGYLHVPTRPHPNDPQDAEWWTRQRVYPRWHPGDLLWVRESWAPYDTDRLETVRVAYRASYKPEREGSAETQGATQQFTVPHYTAMEMSHAIGLYEVAGEQWRPSVHMPRWASRLVRPVTAVRVERVQDISGADAIAEGILQVTSIGPCRAMGWRDYSGGPGKLNPVDSYGTLWDSIYATPSPRYRRDANGVRRIHHYESFPWGGTSGIFDHRGQPHHVSANPWVWVGEF
jgi:hypothetical protein